MKNQLLIRTFVIQLNRIMDEPDRQAKLLEYFRANNIATIHVLRDTYGWHVDVVRAAQAARGMS